MKNKLKMSNHTQLKESSLTTPEDRDRKYKWLPELTFPPLDIEEGNKAVKQMSNMKFIETFPKVDRTYADPAIPLQQYGLISFVPAKGATPNEKGIFGFAKIRGNFGTLIESQQRAEHLIRNVDSYHKIFHAYVGRPFPITLSSNFSEESDEIDIRKEATKAISESIRNKKNQEKKEMKDIKEREKKILEHNKKVENDEYEEDPYENYIMFNVKKAQLTWTFFEQLEKLHKIRNNIIKTKEDIKILDEEHSEFKDQYYEKYLEARREAGIDVNASEEKNGFIRYMVNERSIPTIDTNEILPEVPKEDKINKDED